MTGEAPAFAFPESVLAREVSGEMVLLDLKGEEYYGLDKVGADIVSRLTRLPQAQAMAELTRDYDVEADVLRSDVDELIGKLLGAGLLVRTTP